MTSSPSDPVTGLQPRIDALRHTVTSGATLDLDWRREQLGALRRLIVAYKDGDRRDARSALAPMFADSIVAAARSAGGVAAAIVGFFAVSGAGTALAFGASPVGAVLLGMLTAVGGGTVRDILLSRIPSILYQDLYATSALVGALIVVVCEELGFDDLIPATVGVIAAITIRLVAWRFKISAPGVPWRDSISGAD